MKTTLQRHRKQSNLKIKLNQQVGAWLAHGRVVVLQSPKFIFQWWYFCLGQWPHCTQLAVLQGGRPVKDHVLVTALATSTRWSGCLCRGGQDLTVDVSVSAMSSQWSSSLLTCITFTTVYTLARPTVEVWSDRHWHRVRQLNWEKNVYTFNGTFQTGSIVNS